MSFTKTLLAGAAICALTSVTALANPGMHLFAGQSGAKAIHLKNTHFKTNVGQSRKGQHHTSTYTFTGNFNVSTAYKNPITLPAYAFVNTSVCAETGKQKIKFSKDSHATIKPYTTVAHLGSGACPNTSFTFYGGIYTLTSKKLKKNMDSFVGTLTDKNTSSGYTLKFVENWDLTFNK